MSFGGTFLGVYVKFAMFYIKRHVAAGTTSKISRAHIEEQILESIDKVDIPIAHKMACNMAILQYGTFTAFWAGVQLEHSLPFEAIMRYGIDYTLITSDQNFASEIVEEENAIAGAKAAAQNASESSDDESSGEDDLEAGNLSAATLVDSPAPAATAAVAKQVKRAKPQSNRNAGPMAKKAGVTKASRTTIVNETTVQKKK